MRLTSVLINKLQVMHPGDVANLIENLKDQEKQRVFKVLSDAALSEIFAYLDEEDAADCLQLMSDKRASNVLGHMKSDEAADIINELDKDKIANYLKLLDEETRQKIEALRKYSDDFVGSIMNTSFIKLEASLDVKDAMKILLKRAPHVEVINTLMVENDEEFVGILDFRKLIMSKSPCRIGEITNKNAKYCEDFDSREYAIKIINDYDIYALPVLKNNKVVGVVSIDDSFSAMQEETLEDYTQLAGISGEFDENETVLLKVKKRLPWLSILIVLSLAVCWLISAFDNVIEAITALVLFQSVIKGLSGNVGTQSLAICVRSIANRELLTKKAIVKHCVLEFRNGLVLGLIIGLFTFVIGAMFLRLVVGSVWMDAFRISGVVGVSIALSLSLSSLFGCLVPILFNSMHIDPSAASGPFITTTIDLIAIAVYFSLAIAFLI
ncbi:MAG: magnesium transporter [Bacilli bacterium]